MSAMRKLALTLASVGIIAGVTLVAASAQGGKGGGCGFGPGICSTDAVAAHGDFVPADGTQSFDISLDVERTTFIFRPKGGGTPIFQHATVVNVVTFTPQFEFDCFVVPDTQFVVSRDAQSASLNATVTADETCPGFPLPLASVNGVLPFAGGGGPPPGPQVPLPLGLQFNWNGPGASFSNVSDTVSRCTGIETTAHFNGVFSQAMGGGTVTFPDGSTIAEILPPANFGGNGFIENFDETFNQTGQPAAECSFS